AGDQPGVDYYEADITVDELAELVFADLGLPHLDQKPTPELQQEAFAFRDVRRHGITGNLDRRSEERRVGKHCTAGRSPRPYQAEDGIRDFHVTGVQTCALPISRGISRGWTTTKPTSPWTNWRNWSLPTWACPTSTKSPLRSSSKRPSPSGTYAATASRETWI